MALPVWNSNLLDLTVNGVTVSGFSSLRYNYNVVLPSGTTAIPVVDGKSVYSKATKVVTAAAALPGSSTVVVTAPDGTSKTYTITFTVPENTNATLSDLQVKGVTVASFDPATDTYNVLLPSASKSAPMVTATAFDANATMVIADASALPGATTVEVTAQDGITKLTYTVNFTVAAMLAFCYIYICLGLQGTDRKMSAPAGSKTLLSKSFASVDLTMYSIGIMS